VRSRGSPPLHRLAAALALALAAAPARAAPRPDDLQVKAAMLLNLLKFVEWPRAAAAELRVCALRVPVLSAAVDAAARVGGPAGRSIAVRDERREADLATCDVVILGPDSDDAVEPLAGRLGEAGVLTVAETEGFAARGVMVNFVLDAGRVRFEVNLEAVRRARLRLSSKLLRLARVVGGAP
jgi:hypothetical protein